LRAPSGVVGADLARVALGVEKAWNVSARAAVLVGPVVANVARKAAICRVRKPLYNLRRPHFPRVENCGGGGALKPGALQLQPSLQSSYLHSLVGVVDIYVPMYTYLHNIYIYIYICIYIYIYIDIGYHLCPR
jgi:hypothetical protein